jgi:DNA-binding LytR/AlgR family response regulator
MIKAIAIDDEPPALKVIETFCNQIDYIDLQKTFTKPAEALNFLKENSIDLIFLDINMPSQNGIDFYKSIPNSSAVIFTTAYSEYAVDGFNLNALDYLLKPFSISRFQQAVNKAKEYLEFINHKESSKLTHLFVKADYSLIKINFSDIAYIEGLDDYLKIHIKNSKTIVARMTMKVMIERLPKNRFIRVHRSFIVPLDNIKSIRSKTILLDKFEIPIGMSYEAEFLKKFGNR